MWRFGSGVQPSGAWTGLLTPSQKIYNQRCKTPADEPVAQVEPPGLIRKAFVEAEEEDAHKVVAQLLVDEAGGVE